MTPSYIILNYLTVSQSLFYWIIYSYSHENASDRLRMYESLNPYFIGLSILIPQSPFAKDATYSWSQSLFYWIIYSYISKK